MPEYEVCDFDTNLCGFKVGRIDLEEEDLQGDLRVDLRRAEQEGIKLLYLISPKYEVDRQQELEHLEASFPGTLVDWKTLYSAPLDHWSEAELLKSLQEGGEVEIIRWDRDDCPHTLTQLSLDAGVYSRFKVDRMLPEKVYAGVFGGWIKNSINKKMANETFVAVHRESKKEIGLVTVKQKGPAMVDIGLLAVDSNHRRKGISRSLLCKAAQWSQERLKGISNARLQVVTQGANATACLAYENFGFTIESTQIVNHVWLPEHLGGLQHEAAAAKLDNLGIPFCKQYLTGNETLYINEILDSGLLNSASKFTSLCAMRLRKVLNGEEFLSSNPNSPTRGARVIASSSSSASAVTANADNDDGRGGGGKADCDEVVVTASGTAALEMAALLCEVGPGDEVIMPSYTFSSTANAFVLRGAVPVFVDIRADTLNIDETLVEAAVTARTKVICVVHYGGVACEMDTICDIASRHSLLVVEDAAQAFLSSYKGRKLGTIGDLGCFSFHYTKNIICGEGGALAVNRSPARAKRALILWEKGTNRCDFMSRKVDKYEWVDVGSSNVPSEISSAILWAQLQEADRITRERQLNFTAYREGLQHLADKNLVRIPVVPTECESNAHIFFLVLPTKRKRDEVQRYLKGCDISVFSHYVPLHSSPAGRKYGRVASNSEAMAVTDTTSDCLLRLPMWVGDSRNMVKQVIQAVNAACENLIQTEY